MECMSFNSIFAFDALLIPAASSWITNRICGISRSIAKTFLIGTGVAIISMCFSSHFQSLPLGALSVYLFCETTSVACHFTLSHEPFAYVYWGHVDELFAHRRSTYWKPESLAWINTRHRCVRSMSLFVFRSSSSSLFRVTLNHANHVVDTIFMIFCSYILVIIIHFWFSHWLSQTQFMFISSPTNIFIVIVLWFEWLWTMSNCTTSINRNRYQLKQTHGDRDTEREREGDRTLIWMNDAICDHNQTEHIQLAVNKRSDTFCCLSHQTHLIRSTCRHGRKDRKWKNRWESFVNLKA